MDYSLYTIEKRGIFFKTYLILKDGILLYTVKGSGFLTRFRIYDQMGLEVLQIKKLFSFLKLEFRLMEHDSIIAELKKESKLFKNNLLITSIHGDYYLSGNFKRNDFTLLKGEEEVAKISRHGLFSKQKYGIAIASTEEPLFILGITMVVELMIRVQNARNSAAS